jgi:hypothetical protein
MEQVMKEQIATEPGRNTLLTRIAHFLNVYCDFLGMGRVLNHDRWRNTLLTRIAHFLNVYCDFLGMGRVLNHDRFCSRDDLPAVRVE